jgi:ADP-ribose pyrophosphatase
VSPFADTPVTRSAAGRFRHLGDDVVHHGAIWDVVDAEFESPDGERFRRDIVRSRGAVGVIPLVDGPDGTPHTVMVRQYRPPFDDTVLEIPAGIRDVEGEDDTTTAHRELIEEVGLDAASIAVLASFLPSAGMTDSVTTICVARDCRRVGRQVHGPEETHMVVVELPLADAIAMVHAGEIVDAKSVIALLMLESGAGRGRG